MYKISAPSQLLFTMPTDLVHSPSNVHISSPGGDNDSVTSWDMEIPAIILESLRPNLVQSSESTDMEVVGEDTGSGCLESTSGVTVHTQSLDVEIVDLTV